MDFTHVALSQMGHIFIIWFELFHIGLYEPTQRHSCWFIDEPAWQTIDPAVNQLWVN